MAQQHTTSCLLGLFIKCRFLSRVNLGNSQAATSHLTGIFIRDQSKALFAHFTKKNFPSALGDFFIIEFYLGFIGL